MESTASCSIHCEVNDLAISLHPQESVIHDESYVNKREAASVDDQIHKKSQKRKRSSLSSKRRSILGADDIPPPNVTSSESGSQGSGTSSEVLSQKDRTESSQESEKRLKVNPANLEMDKTIAQIEGKIDVLKQECSRWDEILEELQNKVDKSKLLASNLTLPASDVPACVKDLGVSRYISCEMLDLKDVRTKLCSLLESLEFDREACAKDLKLMEESAEAVQNSTNFKILQLSVIKEKEWKSTLQSKGGDLSEQHYGYRTHGDSKETVQDLINIRIS